MCLALNLTPFGSRRNTRKIDARHFSPADIDAVLPLGADPDGVAIVFLVSALPSWERERADSISQQLHELLPQAIELCAQRLRLLWTMAFSARASGFLRVIVAHGHWIRKNGGVWDNDLPSFLRRHDCGTDLYAHEEVLKIILKRKPVAIKTYGDSADTQYLDQIRKPTSTLRRAGRC